MSDREIADLLRSDEEAAFRLLYRRYAGQLLAVAYRFTGDRDKAEDVLQEAMIKACRHAETFSYRGDGSLYGWVKRIVVHTALNSLKSFHEAHMCPMDDLTEVAAEEDSVEEVSLLERVNPELLLQMIGELPEGYRQVFSLYAIEGHSHREIGEMLGIGERSSASQYCRAKKRLKDKLEQWIKERERE